MGEVSGRFPEGTGGGKTPEFYLHRAWAISSAPRLGGRKKPTSDARRPSARATRDDARSALGDRNTNRHGRKDSSPLDVGARV